MGLPPKITDDIFNFQIILLGLSFWDTYFCGKMGKGTLSFLDEIRTHQPTSIGLKKKSGDQSPLDSFKGSIHQSKKIQKYDMIQNDNTSQRNTKKITALAG